LRGDLEEFRNDPPAASTHKRGDMATLTFRLRRAPVHSTTRSKVSSHDAAFPFQAIQIRHLRRARVAGNRDKPRGACAGSHRVEWRPRHLPRGLPGSVASYAFGVNNAGRVAGYSIAGNSFYAAEWSGGKVIDLRGLPGYSNNQAYGINNAGPIWPGRGHIPELHRSIVLIHAALIRDDWRLL
jgi:hypothetical protein